MFENLIGDEPAGSVSQRPAVLPEPLPLGMAVPFQLLSSILLWGAIAEAARLLF